MKSKFIGTILAIAIVLSMVMMPALPGVAVAATLNSGLEVVPNDTSVGFTQDFDLEIWVRAPSNQSWDTADAHLNFSTTFMQVNGIAAGALPICLGSAYNNTLGTIDYTAGALMAPYPTGDQLVCTVNCTSKSTTGISAIEFVTVPNTTRITDVIFGGQTLLNWTLVVDGELKVGSPALTVNVTPAGMGDVDVTGLSVPTSYPNVSYWAWGDVVQLTAQDPAAGWKFDHWSGNLTGDTNPDTVTMDDARSVMAHFVMKPCDLDVDPNTIELDALEGANTDSGTVTISNLGGGEMCWAVGYSPIWSVGDTWSYWNTYDEAPPTVSFANPLYNPLLPCPVQNTQLDLTVMSETNCTYTAFADWPGADPQRADSAGAPVCMQDAWVVVDKCSLDYIQQLANLTIYMGPPPGLPAQVLVSWDYFGCHGWPYYPGKSWSYNMTIVKPAPLPTVVVTGYAIVTAGPVPDPIMLGFTDCYVITHCLNPGDIANTTFMQQYWSDTARNFVYQWDGGTFLAPPLDQRIYMGSSITGTPAPSCCDAPSWLSFDQLDGSCGIGGSDVLTVTADGAGLAQGWHNVSFCISTCCCSGVDYECVDVNFQIKPPTELDDLIRDLPPDALLPDAERPGDTFYVYVNFTAPVNQFNSIGVTDYAPAGWLVETENSWCVPPASYNKSNYNKAEYAWAGPYNATATFSAKYKVTIPATASPGSNFWPECSAMPCPPCGGSPINNYPAWVDYWFGPDGPYETMICDEREKVVTVPGCVTGETRDVLGNVLDTVTVNLWEDDLPLNTVTGDVWEAQDSSSIVGTEAVYELCADDTGMYYLKASKYCYFSINTRPAPPAPDGGDMPSSRNPAYPDYIDWSTPELLAAGNVTDFVGDYGLVCKAASMSMAMEAVNHMLFVPEEPLGVPHPDWKLSGWKVSQVVHSWQVPAGCACC